MQAKALLKLAFIFSVVIGQIFAVQSSVAASPTPPILCESSAISCNSEANESDEMAKKWHPGHYMQLLRNNRTLSQENRFAQYDGIGNDRTFEGVFVPWRWSQLEGATKGDYSQGIEAIRSDIEYLKSLPQPKRFILKIIDFHYGNTAGDPTASSYFPQYLRDQNLVYQGGNAVGWCRWNKAAMDHYIDLVRAYAQAFDNEPFFEGVILYKETAPTLGGGTPCGYTLESYFQQTSRLASEATKAFLTSNVLLAHNYMGNQQVSGELIGELANARAGISGPDVLPPSCAYGNAGANGTWAYRSFTGTDGGVDFRGTIPSIWSIENSEMGGELGYCYPDELHSFANDTLHASHLGWDRNTFRGDIGMQWNAIREYLSQPSSKLTHTNCPTTYVGGCISN